MRALFIIFSLLHVVLMLLMIPPPVWFPGGVAPYLALFVCIGLLVSAVRLGEHPTSARHQGLACLSLVWLAYGFGLDALYHGTPLIPGSTNAHAPIVGLVGIILILVFAFTTGLLVWVFRFHAPDWNWNA